MVTNDDFGLGFISGIVAMVLILGIFALGYEQGQKAAQKPVAAEVRK